MPNFLHELDVDLCRWLESQAVFFIATADAEGRINLSPKGTDSLRCIHGRSVAYLDLTGSGNETAAHLLADGRITLMACSFGAKPRILRIYGTGRTVRPGHAEWDDLYARFPPQESRRQIVCIEAESIQTSCGFGVPVAADGFMAREMMEPWAEKKGGQPGVRAYQLEKNRRSIDDLPTGIDA
jgi:hypothetical protein